MIHFIYIHICLYFIYTHICIYIYLSFLYLHSYIFIFIYIYIIYYSCSLMICTISIRMYDTHVWVQNDESFLLFPCRCRLMSSAHRLLVLGGHLQRGCSLTEIWRSWYLKTMLCRGSYHVADGFLNNPFQQYVQIFTVYISAQLFKKTCFNPSCLITWLGNNKTQKGSMFHQKDCSPSSWVSLMETPQKCLIWWDMPKTHAWWWMMCCC